VAATEVPAAPAIEIDGEPTVLYRLFGVAEVLLYVGISRNPAGRWAQHAAEKTWWPEVARKTVVMYGSRREAEIAEGRVIRTESPLHNIATGRSDPEARRATVRKLPVRKPALARQPPGREIPREPFSLEPFIRAYAASHKCSYATAEGKLVFSGIIHDYMDRFADPSEAMAALEKDMAAQRRVSRSA
jgi:hypothetical protein